jgi:putative transposase
MFDQTEDGRRLKWLPICDEFTRESVALEVERRMESADVVRVLAAAVAQRGYAPSPRRQHNPPPSKRNQQTKPQAHPGLS